MRNEAKAHGVAAALACKNQTIPHGLRSNLEHAQLSLPSPFSKYSCRLGTGQLKYALSWQPSYKHTLRLVSKAEISYNSSIGTFSNLIISRKVFTTLELFHNFVAVSYVNPSLTDFGVKHLHHIRTNVSNKDTLHPRAKEVRWVSIYVVSRLINKQVCKIYMSLYLLWIKSFIS